MKSKFNEKHILSICESEHYGIFKHYGTFNPYMKAQVAVDELCRYFLGENWYDDSGATHVEQINTNIVAAIERNYKGVKLGWFKRKKFDFDHVYNLTDHKGWEGCILSPPMKAQVAVHELCRYFLGDNWYDSSGAIHPEQVNTAIVCEIEKSYNGAKIKFGHKGV